MRIVSLLPSATEIVCALGARPDLAGVSHECDFPSDVIGLPVLTAPRVDTKTSSLQIDKNVRGAAAQALAIYQLDREKLKAISPDVIVTQDLCDVCAVSYNDVRDAAKEITGKKVEIVSLKPERFFDIFDDIVRVGEAIGRVERATSLVAELKSRAASIKERASRNSVRPEILTIEWLDPVMIGGTWMPEMIDMCFAVPLITKPGEKSPAVTLQQLEAVNPEGVLIKPCGFDIARTLTELQLLKKNLPWDDWDVVMQGRIYISDGNQYFNRPGPRIVESLEILAACVHPKQFRDFRMKHAKDVVEVQMDLTLKRWDEEYIGIE
ncbi:MAG: cobalamin-binding protein [Planctomycetes bacterium]|nr:cobalamin-binding protein [Planctomycetota bacterium]